LGHDIATTQTNLHVNHASFFIRPTQQTGMVMQ